MDGIASDNEKGADAKRESQWLTRSDANIKVIDSSELYQPG